MATITSLGVGSGLPLQTTLDQLSTFEKQRLDPISQQQADNTVRQKAYDVLKTSLDKFRAATGALNSADLFKTTKASSTNSDIKVETVPGVAPGRYEIKVDSIARAQSLATVDDAVEDATTALEDSGSGQTTITIKQANGKSLTVNLAQDKTSLEGVRDAINGANGDVTASIVKVKENDYRLVISTAQSGTENRISTIDVQGGGKLAGILQYGGDSAASKMEQTVEPKDATLTMNGLTITRPTNTITDAPKGMTLTLTKAGAAGTITVDKSTADAKSAVKSWVDSYNSLLDTIGSLTKYTPVDPGAKSQSTDNGPLLGDSIVSSIKTQIRNQFILTGSHSSLKTLAEIGISTTDFTTGKLTLDEKQLDKALSDSPEAVSQLLVGDSKSPGVMGNINKLVTGYTSSTGAISNVEKNLSKQAADLKRRYDAVNANINDTIAGYKKQFTALDVLVKKMNETSQYLTQQFNALTKSNDNK